MEVNQKYFLDPTFGGALVPGQRNVFTTTEDLTGIAFATKRAIFRRWCHAWWLTLPVALIPNGTLITTFS